MPNSDYFESFFSPSSVAIVGISRKQPSLGQMILNNLINSGYNKSIFLINPKTPEINGYKCYPSITDIEDPIELLIVLVPAKYVLSILDDAGKKGVKAIIVVTAGFSEVSEAGKGVETQMLEIAQKFSMRLIGPNSMGTFSSSVHTSFSPIPIIDGEVAYLSQSGSILVVAMEHMLPFKIGFSRFISLGNKIDINTNHALEYLKADPVTKIVNGYLESFSDPLNFREVATSLTKTKPFILVKGGRTEAGARAATSHTGALAGEDKLISAVLKSSGVILADTIEEQVQISRFLKKYPRISNNGIAIVSSAGGPGILASDEIINHKLKLSNFLPETKNRLNAIIPPEGSIDNPVDILAAANEQTYQEVIEVLLEDPDVAAIIVLIVHPVLISTQNLLARLSHFDKMTIPIICCYLGPDSLSYQDDTNLIITSSSNSAIQMIKAGQYYSNWLQNFQEYNNFSHLQESSKMEGKLTNQEILRNFGFEFPDTLIVNELTPITQFMTDHNSIVLKILHKNFSHKSDVGGVFIDVRNQDELQHAWDNIQEIYSNQSIEKNDRFVEVQEYVGNGIEVALGIVHDPMFGHFVMVGSGGTQVELFEDVKFHPLPISRKSAKMMLHGLKLEKLLSGFRGGITIEISRIVELILQLDKMIKVHPNIKELDLNPLIIDNTTGKIQVVDARIEYL